MAIRILTLICLILMAQPSNSGCGDYNQSSLSTTLSLTPLPKEHGRHIEKWVDVNGKDVGLIVSPERSTLVIAEQERNKLFFLKDPLEERRWRDEFYLALGSRNGTKTYRAQEGPFAGEIVYALPVSKSSKARFVSVDKWTHTAPFFRIIKLDGEDYVEILNPDGINRMLKKEIFVAIPNGQTLLHPQSLYWNFMAHGRQPIMILGPMEHDVLEHGVLQAEFYKEPMDDNPETTVGQRYEAIMRRAQNIIDSTSSDSLKTHAENILQDIPNLIELDGPAATNRLLVGDRKIYLELLKDIIASIHTLEAELKTIP